MAIDMGWKPRFAATAAGVVNITFRLRNPTTEIESSESDPIRLSAGRGSCGADCSSS